MRFEQSDLMQREGELKGLATFEVKKEKQMGLFMELIFDSGSSEWLCLNGSCS